MHRKAPTLAEFNAAGHGRRFLAAPTAWDIEARTVDLAFSSEYAEGERSFGIEILDHSPGACRLDRLRDSGAVLVNHDTADQVGVVVSAHIGADRIGRATVRFGNSARASDIFDDVVSGIRKHVSVGYRALDFKHQETRADGVEVYLVTSWEPCEISFVPVPFDPSVGVGRNLHETTMNQRTTEPSALGLLERSLKGAAPASPILSLVREARRAVAAPHGPQFAGSMRNLRMADVITASAPNPERAYPLGLTSRPAGSELTFHASVLEHSRVCRAGASLVVVDTDSVPEARGDILILRAIEAKFAVVTPAAFNVVADGANVAASARPVLVADIDLGNQASHALRFDITRRDQKDQDDASLAFEIEQSIARGLAGLADRVLLDKIAAGNPANFSLAAAASSGVLFSELRALVGRNGTGAAINASGDLTAAGIRAELTDQTALTLVGVMNRAAVACSPEVRVLMQRTDLQGSLRVTAFVSLQGLVPSPATFWKAAA